MNDVRDWLVIGTVLIYIGVSGLLNPTDMGIKTIIGNYIMPPVGFLLLIRGLVALLAVRNRSWFEKLVALISYPALTLGVMLLLFKGVGSVFRGGGIQPLASPSTSRAVGIGAGLVFVGLLLRKSVEWIEGRQLMEG